MLRIDAILGPVCAALAVAAMVVFGGCGGSRGVGPMVLDDVSAPVVRGVEAGLEARLWVVENRSGVLGGALREFGPPATAGASEIAVWQRNGFRVLEVPLDRLEGLRAGLPTIGPLHREWLGLLPEWVEVVRGAELAGQQPVRLDTGSAVLGPGRLRLVTRCWAMPSVGALPEGGGAGALLHIEVMPQLGRVGRGERDPLGLWLGTEHESARTAVRGMAFTRLRLGVVSAGGSAIVIVPEDPDVDWHAEAAGRPESGFEARQREVVGPQMLAMPTLGELMLSSLALPESVGDARVVVVLVPRVPERFELLPR